MMRDYGVTVCRYGIVLHEDGRPRVRDSVDGQIRLMVDERERAGRGAIGEMSHASQRRLQFRAANVLAIFKSMLTLTYHAIVETWENEEERNYRIVRRSKKDLNRFLASVRSLVGRYVWVQEFQARGVIHYHVVCENEVEESRIKVAWCRAIQALGDDDALRHGVKVDGIRGERQARHYLSKYVTKQRQKLLPKGVQYAGRWWGSSHSLELEVLEELVTCRARDFSADPVAVRVRRDVRRYLRKSLGFKFRGGAFVDWGGGLSGKVAEMIRTLRPWYQADAGSENAGGGQ